MMKTARIFILLIICSFLSNAQENIITYNGNFKNITLSNIPVEDILNVKTNFQELKKFGTPLKTDSIFRSAEPEWVFYYPNFTLTYVQYFPTGPELLKIEIFNDKANLSINGKNFFNRNNQSLKDYLSTFEYRSLNAQKEITNFGKQSQYLEFHLISDEIQKIIYRVDPNL